MPLNHRPSEQEEELGSWRQAMVKSTHVSSPQHSRHHSTEGSSWVTIIGEKEKVFILKEQSTLLFAEPQRKETNLRVSEEVELGANRLNKWTRATDAVLLPSRGCHRRATKKRALWPKSGQRVNLWLVVSRSSDNSPKPSCLLFQK